MTLQISFDILTYVYVYNGKILTLRDLELIYCNIF